MFRIYTHTPAQPRENIDFATEPDDKSIDAWICPLDHEDRALFDECGKDLVYDNVEAAVTALVCQAVDLVAASEAWTRKAGKSKNGGLNAAGRRSYKKGTLKKPVPKGKRHKSFCARMKGMKKKLTGAKARNDPNSRINKSLRAWHC